MQTNSIVKDFFGGFFERFSFFCPLESIQTVGGGKNFFMKKSFSPGPPGGNPHLAPPIKVLEKGFRSKPRKRKKKKIPYLKIGPKVGSTKPTAPKEKFYSFKGQFSQNLKRASRRGQKSIYGGQNCFGSKVGGEIPPQNPNLKRHPKIGVFFFFFPPHNRKIFGTPINSPLSFGLKYKRCFGGGKNRREI